MLPWHFQDLISKILQHSIASGRPDRSCRRSKNALVWLSLKAAYFQLPKIPLKTQTIVEGIWRYRDSGHLCITQLWSHWAYFVEKSTLEPNQKFSGRYRNVRSFWRGGRPNVLVAPPGASQSCSPPVLHAFVVSVTLARD